LENPGYRNVKPPPGLENPGYRGVKPVGKPRLSVCNDPFFYASYIKLGPYVKGPSGKNVLIVDDF
jgi:hypothetical protein